MACLHLCDDGQDSQHSIIEMRCFGFQSVLVAGIAVPFVLFISVIELVVGFIQAFIFTILSALFIGMAVEEKHAEH